MSRTDKDRPYEVRVRDPYEHTYEYHYHHGYARAWNPHRELGCDLDKWDAVRDRVRPRWYFNCGRDLSAVSRWRTTNVPGWYVNHTWTAPERLRERVSLRDAAREYNAGGDLDGFDFDCPQHRHRSAWWWD